VGEPEVAARQDLQVRYRHTAHTSPSPSEEITTN